MGVEYLNEQSTLRRCWSEKERPTRTRFVYGLFRRCLRDSMTAAAAAAAAAALLLRT